MPIPREHQRRLIYHLTHISNVSLILKHGILANTDRVVPLRRRRSIAEQGIQARRAAMVVPCGPGGVVHDYVPLYFGSLSPMLLSVVNRKNVDQMEIVYFEYAIALVERDDVVFTDSSANTTDPQADC
jgi:hypothetical protein